MPRVALLLIPAALLLGVPACGSMHALGPYWTDDTGSSDTDTDPADTDTDPVDTDTDSGTDPDTDTDPDTGGSTVTLCDNTCFYAYDGECDDGGPNSDWDLCALGSDCADCGPREVVLTGCDDSCVWAADGWCDDGGPGSDTDWCTWGTDCTDCGPR